MYYIWLYVCVCVYIYIYIYIISILYFGYVCIYPSSQLWLASIWFSPRKWAWNQPPVAPLGLTWYGVANSFVLLVISSNTILLPGSGFRSIHGSVCTSGIYIYIYVFFSSGFWEVPLNTFLKLLNPMKLITMSHFRKPGAYQNLEPQMGAISNSYDLKPSAHLGQVGWPHQRSPRPCWSWGLWCCWPYPLSGSQ